MISAKRGLAGWCAFLVTAIVACGDTPEAALRASIAEGCTINSECSSPLVCAFRTCHVQCTTTRDCSAYGGGLCVQSDKPYRVCQNPDETSCIRNSECPGQQICGIDAKCRDACATNRDCADKQTCTSGVCADDADLVGGALPNKVPPTTSGGSSCVRASDCPGDLVCLFDTCTVECVTPKDCEDGRACIASRCASPNAGGSAGSPSSAGAGGVAGSSASAGSAGLGGAGGAITMSGGSGGTTTGGAGFTSAGAGGSTSGNGGKAGSTATGGAAGSNGTAGNTSAGAGGQAGQPSAGAGGEGGASEGGGGATAGAAGSESGAAGSDAGSAGAGGSDGGAAGSDAGSGGSSAGAAGSDAGSGGSAGAAGSSAGAAGTAGAGGQASLPPIQRCDGYNENTPPSTGNQWGTKYIGFQYVPTESRTVAGFEWLTGTGGSQSGPDAYLALFDDVGGKPGSPLAPSSTFNVPGGATDWYGGRLSTPVAVTAGTTYWIVFRPMGGVASLSTAPGTNVKYRGSEDLSSWDGPYSGPWMIRVQCPVP